MVPVSYHDFFGGSNLGTLAIFFYLFAVARAWQLVGARDTGLLARVAEMALSHPGHAPGDDGDGGAD